MLEILSGSHIRFSVQYHFVWICKYRRALLLDQGRQARLKEIVEGIAERYEFEVVQLGTDGDHVHLFLRSDQNWSPARIMNVVKSLSARFVLREDPELRKILWGASLWAVGYYVGTVGDGPTAEVIRKYIEKQGKSTNHKPFNQLKLF